MRLPTKVKRVADKIGLTSDQAIELWKRSIVISTAEKRINPLSYFRATARSMMRSR